MEIAISQFVSMYLLLPIIGIVLTGAMYFIAKKNELLSNKKIIFYYLIICIVLALPGFLGFLHFWFMPYAYLGLVILYFFLGWWNIFILRKLIPQLEEKSYCIEILCMSVIMFTGYAFFALIFNLCNELQYGLWAGTCMLAFIFVSVFLAAYKTLLYIPLEIYDIWSYKDENIQIDISHIDMNKEIVVELNLVANIVYGNRLNIKAKALEDMPFGYWFKVFVNDYNVKKSGAPIVFADSDNSYGWTFYTYSKFLKRKKHINTRLSFSENKIYDHARIIARRTEFNQQQD